MEQCLYQTYPAAHRSMIFGSSLKQGESHLRAPNSSYTYYPLLVGVYPLLQILLFARQLRKVAFKALPAHQVSRNVYSRNNQIALANHHQRGFNYEHKAITLPVSSSCKVRSILSTVPDMFCALLCICCTVRAPERTERSCCLPERPAGASIPTTLRRQRCSTRRVFRVGGL